MRAVAKRVRKSAGPRPGASLVDATFTRVGLGDKARDYAALWAWHRLSGERFGRRTRAERVQGRTLLVRVASAPWANELGYLRAHLYAMQQAMKDGADVRGYFHWTLMDNYELNDGFTQKVGLFSVDPDDPELKRVPKGSAEVFREAARGMGLTPGTEMP